VKALEQKPGSAFRSRGSVADDDKDVDSEKYKEKDTDKEKGYDKQKKRSIP
jgi:hypothetical protein